MSERPVELRAILTDIQRRWMRRFVLRAWALGATAATTVLLAYLILREKVAPLQWLGAALCLTSVALIAL